MKVTIIKRATLVPVILMSLFLLAGGCGSKDAENEGCPSGTFTANSTDSLIGPVDEKFLFISPPGDPFTGGTRPFTPLIFEVRDQQFNPRNKVCIRFFTDGFFYTDNVFSTQINAPGNTIIGVTDDVGKVTVYWSTETLPAAQPAVGASAGKDIVAQSFVHAFSGVAEARFLYDWTVQGEQTP
jgi:hypothetical protein